MGLTTSEAAHAHRQLFTEFCLQEMTAGGPDPQIKLTAEAVKLHGTGNDTDMAADAGLFVVPYSCAGAAILWRLWERKPDPLEWVPWLEQHGTVIPIRKERRPVKGAWGRFSVCAASVIDWARVEYPKVSASPYADVYASVTKHVKYIGRYAAMKLLETLVQADLLAYGQDTMVPRDAKFPRRTMALLMPEYSDILLDKGHAYDADVDILCARIRAGIEARIGMPVSWFQIETMLCIYRQSLKGKYPMGRHDSELGHWVTAMSKLDTATVGDLDHHFPFHDLRRQIYDVQYLGEFNTPPWYGIRPELEAARKERIHALGLA
jgi:hypothetical protein